MRMTVSRVSPLPLLLFAMAALCVGETGKEDLIQNPGFEQGQQGWNLHGATDGAVRSSPVSDAHGGKHAARLEMSGQAKPACLEQVIKLKAPAGRRYRFSFWAKGEAPIRYNFGYIHELPSNTYHWITPQAWREGWQELSTVFDRSPDTAAFAVGVYIRHEGAFLVDDFSLREYEGPLEPVSRVGPQKPAPAAPTRESQEAATQFFRTHPSAIDFERKGDCILFANRQVGVEFRQSQGGFQVVRLYSIKHQQDLLTASFAGQTANLFQIVLKGDPAIERQTKVNPFTIGPFDAKETSAERTGDDVQSVLHLAWKGIDLSEDQGAMDVEVLVTLKADDPLSYWRFNVRNRSIKYGIERVYFPVMDLAPIGEAEDNVYIFPRDRGRLVEAPFHRQPGYGDGVHRGGRYPAAFGMQFQALYNKKTGAGVYLGTQDPAPDLMNTEAPNCPTHITWKPGHFPPNIGFAEQDFTLPYECVVGAFTGDWWDACQIYRQWALKQSWCRRGPLATRQDIPRWYKEAPLYLVANTYCVESNIAKTVDHYTKFLKWAGLRLPCNWYGWKRYQTELTAYDVPHSYWRTGYRRPGVCGNVHDGNYPRLPALSGFAEACGRLRKAGGTVCPYVCVQIYDQGPTENAPYADEARPHVVRNVQGVMQTYGREPSWAMCTWPLWWRDRLKETCLELLEKEHVGGFYLDTMHGCGEPCFWTPHGHTACGGSALTAGMHALAAYVRDAVKAADPEAITSGEDSSEDLIDVIDGKLYQYTLTPNSRAPLFAAVYQDYIPRYGMTVRTEAGDRFFLEAGSLFVEGAQIGRLPLDPMLGGLSFESPDHREMLAYLGRLVAYYRQEVAKKFLCYGQLMRPLAFKEPDPMPRVSYAADGQTIEQPALLSGVFRSQDGELGIFIVNMGGSEVSFLTEVDLARAGMPVPMAVDVESISPEGDVQPYAQNIRDRVVFRGRLPARHVTMFRVKEHR